MLTTLSSVTQAKSRGKRQATPPAPDASSSHFKVCPSWERDVECPDRPNCPFIHPRFRSSAPKPNVEELNVVEERNVVPENRGGLGRSLYMPGYTAGILGGNFDEDEEL